VANWNPELEGKNHIGYRSDNVAGGFVEARSPGAAPRDMRDAGDVPITSCENHGRKRIVLYLDGSIRVEGNP
jgi:hypothetical protein